MKNNNKKIKVAIVGAGDISDSHVDGWVRSGLAEVVAVMNHHIEKAKKKAKKWDIASHAYDLIPELINAEQPDLIDICTPEHAHTKPALTILDENIPIFCEKIMAASLRDGFRMVKKAREKKIWTGICYNYHFIPALRVLKEIIGSKKEGKISVININTHSYCFHHILQAMLWINGMPERALANGTSREWPHEFIEKFKIEKDLIYLPDKFTGRMEYENGLFISITASLVPKFTPEFSALPFQITAIFENGKVLEITGLDWRNNVIGSAKWLPDGSDEMDKYSQEEEKSNIISFRGYLKDTAEQFIKGANAESTWEDGWNVMVVDHAFLISGRKGTFIDVKDLKIKLEQNEGIINN